MVPSPDPNPPNPRDIYPLLQVLEKPNLLDQDLEVEGDSDGPTAGGVWGPWAPSTFPTPAELEWDPAGDVGGLGPSGQKRSRIPGAPCELCGYRVPQSSGQGLEVRSAPVKGSLLGWAPQGTFLHPCNVAFPFQGGLGPVSSSMPLLFDFIIIIIFF